MRMVSPMGLLEPNRYLRTVSPSTATVADWVTSSSLNDVPLANGQLRTSKYCGSVPITWVAQFWLPNTTCWPDCTPGAVFETDGHSRAIAIASLSNSVLV